jgi:uncharacterized phage-associated protein
MFTNFFLTSSWTRRILTRIMPFLHSHQEGESLMERPHSAIHVANRLLTLGAQAGWPLTPMHLLKLVYLAHGWMLGNYHRPLVEERIEAWAYGPVIPSLYRAVRRYRDRPVDQEIPAPPMARPFDEKETEIIDGVFRAYLGYTAMDLSRLTHLRGSPWYTARIQGGQNAEISDQIIEDYFAARAHGR